MKLKEKKNNFAEKKKLFDQKVKQQKIFLTYFHILKLRLAYIKHEENQNQKKKPWWSFFEKQNIDQIESVERNFCIIKPTRGNFFATGFIKNKNKQFNKVLFTITGGYCGNLGARRRTPTSAKDVGHVVAYRFIEKRIFSIYLIIRGGLNKYIKLFIKGIRQSGLKIKGIRMEWKIAHNGFRLSNKRRV